MRRYWVDQKRINETGGVIDGDTFHHIIDVCRQEAGSRFELLTDNHEAFLVEIIEVGKKSANFEIIEKRTIPPLPSPRIHLCLSVPRFPVFENVIEKAVELGVTDISLFFSDYSFVRTKEKISHDKTERWNRIVKSSTQQSGRGHLMKIHAPQGFQQLVDEINQNPSHLCLFAYEGDSQGKVVSQSIQDTLKAHDLRKYEDLFLFIGSEGGFSTQEVIFMSQKGHHPVHFGQQILRVETACVALVSILKYEAGL